MRFKIFMVLLGLCAFSYVRASEKDILVPSKLWEKIDRSMGEVKDGTLGFFPIKVKLTEKTKGLLQDKDTEIPLPRGGGEIDLSKYVKKEQGTFSVSFELEDYDSPENLQVYFISRSRKRRIDGEIWGAGCRKYLDIKTYFVNTILKQGLTVNTTRNRHLSTLGGSFIFARKSGKQLLLSQVSFTDSSVPQLFCDFHHE